MCWYLIVAFSPALTRCKLVDSSTVIGWRSPVIILGVSCLFSRFYSVFDGAGPRSAVGRAPDS